MKTAVIMTMFRTANFGSALQVYALHRKISALGFKCVEINYPRQMGLYLVRRGVRYYLQAILSKIIYHRFNLEYKQFLERELNLTREYWTSEELEQDPPSADYYITGSDQTFNSTISTWDTSYMLSFVPANKRKSVHKIAYAASFSTGVISNKWKDQIPKLLSDYDAVSTREEMGVGLVEKLTGRHDARWCCDPTMLMTRKEWLKFSEKAINKIRKPYILAYLLNYAVDPYPEVVRLIDEAQERTGYEVIYLLGGKRDMFKRNSRIIKNASVYEFVDLIFNASMIFTSSFHGAAFSVQSGRPFMAFVHNDSNADNRVRSLLEKVGASAHVVDVPIQNSVTFGSIDKWKQSPRIEPLLTQFRDESYNWLKDKLT